MPNHGPLYFDDHATTPLDPRVFAVIRPWYEGAVGNAASTNVHGRRAAEVAQEARASVRTLVGADVDDRVIWTSGATEACQLAIRGVVEACRGPRGVHVVTSAIEHSAVAANCAWVRKHGGHVTVVPVDSRGVVSVASVLAAVRPDTCLVVLMAANNEIGAIQPVDAVAEGVARLNRRRRRPVVVFSDAVQALGRVAPPRADLVTVSGHKMYGPQGVGALVARSGVELAPQMVGGTQEGGMRAGTLPIALVAGLGEAARIMREEGEDEAERVRGLRDALADLLLSALPEDAAVVNGPWGDASQEALRLPGNLNLSFPGVCPIALADATQDLVSVSAGAACRSASKETSPILVAIGGLRADEAATIRFGLGRFTTFEEVRFVADLFARSVSALRRAGCGVRR